MQLVISNNSAQNPQTLDLTNYIRVSDGEGMDPASPTYSDKVISHSLLKEGGFLALENLRNKELVFPLRLKAASASALILLEQQVTQIITTPGATASWQDDGLSQPTIFDLISGQLDVEYRYREAQQFYLPCKLRLFSQPFGRVAAPRPYATASGVGPLLMISPYTSGGATPIIGASTQAGVSGYGGTPNGPSSGVFYWGAPSLAGDAPAQLSMTAMYASQSKVQTALISKLPDQFYLPMTPSQIISAAGWTQASDAGAPEGLRWTLAAPGSQLPPSGIAFRAVPRIGFGGQTINAPTFEWEGAHRLLAFARASGTWGQLSTATNTLQPMSTVASVGPPGSAYNLYDLGTFQLRASEPPATFAKIQGAIPSVGGVASNCALDIGGLLMLPDNATWFLGPSAYAYEGNNVQALLIDDTLGDQFAFQGSASLQTAPSPANLVYLCDRITQWSRGLVPRPDPRNGLPNIAIVALPPGGIASPFPRLTANVFVTERSRYVLP